MQDVNSVAVVSQHGLSEAVSHFALFMAMCQIAPIDADVFPDAGPDPFLARIKLDDVTYRFDVAEIITVHGALLQHSLQPTDQEGRRDSIYCAVRQEHSHATRGSKWVAFQQVMKTDSSMLSHKSAVLWATRFIVG
jgi:hypothetical protein